MANPQTTLPSWPLATGRCRRRVNTPGYKLSPAPGALVHKNAFLGLPYQGHLSQQGVKDCHGHQEHARHDPRVAQSGQLSMKEDLAWMLPGDVFHLFE